MRRERGVGGESARPGELPFDLTVRRRLGRKLVERFMEEACGLFVVTLPAVDETEVGDDLSFALFFAELAKDSDRLLEVLDRGRLGSALGERKPEIVERHGFRMLVAEITDDRQCDPMLRGRLLGAAFTTKLCSVLVEPERLAAPAKGEHSVHPSGVRLPAAIEEDGSAAGRGGCPALRVGSEAP